MGRRRGQSHAQGGDMHERRKIQNRIAQRHYRERQKECLENAHKLLLAHEALQKRCRVTGQGGHGSPLDLTFEQHAQPARSIDEDTLEDVPMDIQQALMRFDSSGGRNACTEYATYYDNLSFKATQGDLPEPGQVRTTMPGPPDDTIHVMVNETPPAACKNTAPRVEVPELFTSVSPSDVFQFPSPSCSDTFEPLLSAGAESPSTFRTYADVDTPSTSSQPTTSEASTVEGGDSPSARACPNSSSDEGYQSAGPTEGGAGQTVSVESQSSRPSCNVEHHDEPVAAAEPRQPVVEDDDEWSTPLLAAAARGHLEMVRLLVQSGADLETKSKSGKTSLCWAVAMRQMETVKCCLDLGANLGAVEDDSGLGLFHKCVLEDDVPLLEILLVCCQKLGEKGREWIHMVDGRNRTPLYLAAEMGKTQIAELFIKAGADIDRR